MLPYLRYVLHEIIMMGELSCETVESDFRIRKLSDRA